MPFLKVPTSLLNPKTKVDHQGTSFPTSLVIAIFIAALPSNFRFCNLPHVCHSKFEGTSTS